MNLIYTRDKLQYKKIHLSTRSKRMGGSAVISTSYMPRILEIQEKQTRTLGKRIEDCHQLTDISCNTKNNYSIAD